MDNIKFKAKIKNFPQGSGIYIFKDYKNKPLYIGKALSLRNRLGSYLKTDDPRLERMLKEANRINLIETENDIEALILESRYIKKYKPAFNIMLRDDKQYFYVVFTQERFPKIFLSHQPQKVNSEQWSVIGKRNEKSPPANYYPPTTSTIGLFTDGTALKTTLRLLRRIFPYCTCRQPHNNFCLNYHIGKCIGVCCLKLKSKNEKVKITIQNSKFKEYQKNIKAIKDILSGTRSSLIRDLENEMKTLSQKQEYEKARELQYKIRKLERVFENAKIIHKSRAFMIYHKGRRILNSLQKLLNLNSPPRRIECYDIANIQGKCAVGAMAVFTNGQPDKNEYRRFKILNSKSEILNKLKYQNSKFKTGGDTGMLREILARRFKHSEWSYPDLVIVDGGKAQLNAALSVLSTFYIPHSTFIIALTKNERHIGEKIYIQNKKEVVPLSKLPVTVKNLLLHINSKAHRFARMCARSAGSKKRPYGRKTEIITNSTQEQLTDYAPQRHRYFEFSLDSKKLQQKTR